MDKLENFLNGYAAAIQLINRAGENGFFIEYVCLATSIIDALLRIAIILNNQLKSKSKDIIDEILYQTDEDKIVSERKIYKWAWKERIITKSLFDMLENLYKKRNRIIHRYIISDISTRQVLDVGIQYERIIPLILERVEKLEERQIELGVGMTVVSDEANVKLRSEIDMMIKKKHRDAILDYGLKKK